MIGAAPLRGTNSTTPLVLRVTLDWLAAERVLVNHSNHEGKVG